MEYFHAQTQDSGTDDTQFFYSRADTVFKSGFERKEKKKRRRSPNSSFGQMLASCEYWGF